MSVPASKWAVVPLLLALAGCASVGPPVAAGYEDYMAAAAQAEAAGSPREAVLAYREAIASDPAGKAPWLEIARIEAGQQRPVEALAAVQEVLRRDPADAEANALYLDVVLQLASEGLARLRALLPDDRVAYLDRAQALVADAVELFGDEVVPAAARARYGSEAVERYRRNLPPVRLDEKQEKVSDPLDVLGGH